MSDTTSQAALPDTSRISVLEEVLRAAQEGRAATETLMWTLGASHAFIGTPDEPTADGTITGTYIITNEQGQSFLPVFTRPELARDFFSTSYAITAEVLLLLETIPAEAGIVLNPGQELGGEIPAELVHQLKAELGLPPR